MRTKLTMAISPALGLGAGLLVSISIAAVAQERPAKYFVWSSACIEDGLSGEARSAASQAVGIYVETCVNTREPIAIHDEFSVFRPELSASRLGTIATVSEFGPPALIIRKMPDRLDPGVMQALRVTNLVTASAFQCKGHVCVPSEYEVYITDEDSGNEISVRINESFRSE